jgi:hypothetical protein
MPMRAWMAIAKRIQQHACRRLFFYLEAPHMRVTLFFGEFPDAISTPEPQ